jgi:cytochrome b subunit of formate dehydrogenase
MSHKYALLSLVYMMSFVIVFDKARWQKKLHRFLSGNLFSREDLTRLEAIWSACQE